MTLPRIPAWPVVVLLIVFLGFVWTPTVARGSFLLGCALVAVMVLLADVWEGGRERRDSRRRNRP